MQSMTIVAAHYADTNKNNWFKGGSPALLPFHRPNFETLLMLLIESADNELGDCSATCRFNSLCFVCSRKLTRLTRPVRNSESNQSLMTCDPYIILFG